MDSKHFLQSHGTRTALFIIGGLVVALLIFQAGEFVGFRKAAFSYGLGDNFHRSFGARRGPAPRGLIGDDYVNANGASGKIISLTLPSLVVQDDDGVEKVVTIASSTVIRQFRDMIQPQQLKTGDTIIVIGQPDNTAHIIASLIRVVPALPPEAATSTLQ